jgi:hypothetical protein
VKFNYNCELEKHSVLILPADPWRDSSDFGALCMRRHSSTVLQITSGQFHFVNISRGTSGQSTFALFDTLYFLQTPQHHCLLYNIVQNNNHHIVSGRVLLFNRFAAFASNAIITNRLPVSDKLFCPIHQTIAFLSTIRAPIIIVSASTRKLNLHFYLRP